jgi:pimeloyl-ACP methyl ester carboxylesterase
MSQVLSLPSFNSTNVRFFTQTLLRRVGLRASAAVAPQLAELWAEQLFLSPPREPSLQHRFFDFLDARHRVLSHRGRSIATWSWGPSEAPGVILAHGWGGAAVQLRPLVFPLLQVGFRVIAFDQPAHGFSGGKLTALPDFAEVLSEVASKHGGVSAAVGHSLGAAAIALAMARGLDIQRTVLISPPADVVAYSRRFARWNWIPEGIRRAMQSATEERYGVRWADLAPERLVSRFEAAALIIHDRGDRVVPYSQGARIARIWRGARLLGTSGLGHFSILEDERATQTAAEFIAGRSQGASRADSDLPYPAPLY